MKKDKIANYMIFFSVAFGLGFIMKEISIVKFFDFFDSNFFVALVTIIVGYTAIYLYKKQQKDFKKDAARLILQEIRYAEQQIRNAKMLSASIEVNYYMANKLLPTNSWHKNIHLFVEDLKEDNQLDLISQFYSHAAYLDEVISIISNEKNKIWNGVREKVSSDGKEIRIEKLVNLPSGFSVPEKCTYQLQAQHALAEVTSRIEFIYNSPAVDKLRSIADGKL